MASDPRRRALPWFLLVVFFGLLVTDAGEIYRVGRSANNRSVVSPVLQVSASSFPPASTHGGSWAEVRGGVMFLKMVDLAFPSVNKLVGVLICGDLTRPGRRGGAVRAEFLGSGAPWEVGEAASLIRHRSPFPVMFRQLLLSRPCIYRPFKWLLHELVLTDVRHCNPLFLPAAMPKGRSPASCMAPQACFVPSGVVPGDEVGCHARRSQSTNGGEGSDCNLNLSLWVLFVKSEEYVVTFVYLEVLSENCNPTALMSNADRKSVV